MSEKSQNFIQRFASALRRGVGYEITELSKDLGAPLETGGRLKAKTEKLVGYLFQNSERLNREVTLVAAYNLEMENHDEKSGTHSLEFL